MNSAKKLIRITTVPISLQVLLTGQMKFMQAQGFDVTMISADGAEVKALVQSENCRHIAVPFTRKITPVRDVYCLWQLIKIFKKERPDIVHTHTPKAGLLGMMAAKITGVKVRIHTVAGLPLMVETGFKFRLLKFIEKLTYASANHVWPNSFSLLKYISIHKLTQLGKLKVISKGSSNGINLSRFSTRSLEEKILAEVKESIAYDPENKYILNIGRLVKDKGIVELVETFCEIRKNDALLKLILVGTFEEDLDVLPQKIMDEIKNNKNIIHINWSSRVEYYIALSALFVFPSHREGFPNVLLQAGALGTAIICSSIPGNTDIVQNNITGLLFDKGNVTEMKNQVMFALNNPETVKAMAATLRETIYASYNRETVWKNILHEYETLT